MSGARLQRTCDGRPEDGEIRTRRRATKRRRKPLQLIAALVERAADSQPEISPSAAEGRTAKIASQGKWIVVPSGRVLGEHAGRRLTATGARRASGLRRLIGDSGRPLAAL